MNYNYKKLGDWVNFISGGTPSKQKPEYWIGDIPWAGSGELSREFIYDTELHISDDGAKNGSKLVPSGTVLIVVRGMSLAKEFRIAMTQNIMAFNQDVKALFPKDGLTSGYLYYYLKFQSENIRGSATEASHGTKKIEMAVLENWPIRIPPLATQTRIAEILSTYDDLIENNRRQIKLLEESARLLFREWFVHLRFPGHESVKIVDGVPEGWEKAPLGSLVSIKKGKNITKETVAEGKVPVVAGGLSPAYYHSESNTVGPVITISASGANAGYVALYYENIWASDCSYIDLNTTTFIYFYYCLLKERQRDINSMQRGAAQPHVYPKDISRLEVLFPKNEMISKFEEMASPFFYNISVLILHNSRLTNSRDLLLPRLMSGELEV